MRAACDVHDASIMSRGLHHAMCAWLRHRRRSSPRHISTPARMVRSASGLCTSPLRPRWATRPVLPPALSVAMPLGALFLASIQRPFGAACSGTVSARRTSTRAALRLRMFADLLSRLPIKLLLRTCTEQATRTPQHTAQALLAVHCPLARARPFGMHLAESSNCARQRALRCRRTAQHTNEAGDRRERIGREGLCGTALCGRSSITNTCTQFCTL